MIPVIRRVAGCPQCVGRERKISKVLHTPRLYEYDFIFLNLIQKSNVILWFKSQMVILPFGTQAQSTHYLSQMYTIATCRNVTPPTMARSLEYNRAIEWQMYMLIRNSKQSMMDQGFCIVVYACFFCFGRIATDNYVYILYGPLLAIAISKTDMYFYQWIQI